MTLELPEMPFDKYGSYFKGRTVLLEDWKNYV